MNSVTIIGSGLAGYNLAKEIRKYDKDIPVKILTADGGDSYSKPMLSNALSKGKTTKQLVISDAAKMAGQLNAQIHTRTTVTSIDPEKRILKTETGEYSFDKLVLAVGASQNKPPISGNASDDIISINNLDDYENFQSKLAGAREIVIIGSGLIGCEFANDLISVNKHVTVVGSAKTPLDRLLLPEIGEKLQAALEQKGVAWKLGVKVEAIESNNNASKYQLKLSDGSVLSADMVLSATGLLPNIDLAKQAGIAVNRGIMVDRYLETSVKDIFAVGDCIEIDGLVLAYVLPIMNSVRALAKTLAGDNTKVNYPAMPIVVKTPDYPMVISPPSANETGEWQLESDQEGVKALFIGKDNSLKGFILTEQKISEKQSLAKQLPAVL